MNYKVEKMTRKERGRNCTPRRKVLLFSLMYSFPFTTCLRKFSSFAFLLATDTFLKLQISYFASLHSFPDCTNSSATNWLRHIIRRSAKLSKLFGIHHIKLVLIGMLMGHAQIPHTCCREKDQRTWPCIVRKLAFFFFFSLAPFVIKS